MGEVGQHATCKPTCGWHGPLLNRRVVIFLVVVYLMATSVNKLALVASRVIHWAFAWHKPVFSAVTMACLAWTWRWQAQRLWASTCTLVHRHALRLHPATYSNLVRDQGAPEATRGLP